MSKRVGNKIFWAQVLEKSHGKQMLQTDDLLFKKGQSHLNLESSQLYFLSAQREKHFMRKQNVPQKEK